MRWVKADERLPEERVKVFVKGPKGAKFVADVRYIGPRFGNVWTDERGNTRAVSEWLEEDDEGE